jgi:hypothetical protein
MDALLTITHLTGDATTPYILGCSDSKRTLPSPFTAAEKTAGPDAIHVSHVDLTDAILGRSYKTEELLTSGSWGRRLRCEVDL